MKRMYVDLIVCVGGTHCGTKKDYKCVVWVVTIRTVHRK